LSSQERTRLTPQARKITRPPEFRQPKQLTARADYNCDRMMLARTQRDYFSPYTCRQ
jgi:hypothetical protein